MLPHERVTSLAVVKAFPARFPMNYGEVFPIVLGVATDAILTALTLVDDMRVVPLIFLNTPKNLSMALHAFKLTSSSA